MTGSNANHGIAVKQICYLIDLMFVTSVSIFPLMPWPHLMNCLLLLDTPFCCVLAFVAASRLRKVFPMLHYYKALLWQMTDSTTYSSSLFRTAPCCRSQWIPNLNRWLHLDRITHSSASMGRKVDFTFDLWVLLTAPCKIFCSFNTAAEQVKSICWLYTAGKLVQQEIRKSTLFFFRLVDVTWTCKLRVSS